MVFEKFLAVFQSSKVRLTLRECPACGPSLFVRLGEDEVAVRCLRCSATPVHLAVIAAVKASLPHLRRRSAYELSCRGPVLRYLRRQFETVTCSEYFKGTPSGTMVDGVRCEDVQKLSFEDSSFDLCTSTEVFEHVPDDLAGYREIFRVLRPGGYFVFTVPLTGGPLTTERVSLVDGDLIYFMPPAYHGDKLTGSNSVLVFRDYGADICERVREAGFSQASIIESATKYFGYSRGAVVAVKYTRHHCK